MFYRELTVLLYYLHIKLQFKVMKIICSSEGSNCDSPKSKKSHNIIKKSKLGTTTFSAYFYVIRNQNVVIYFVVWSWEHILLKR